MMIVLEHKDPSDVLDYGFDWSDVLAGLGGDTIASTTWTTSPAGLTLGAQHASGAIRSVFLSGGVAGVDYTLTCTITTVGGRTIERSATIYVEER